MSKKKLEVKVSKKNFFKKEKNFSAFETSSLLQQDILIDKKSNLAVPNLSNVIDSKKFSEENKK